MTALPVALKPTVLDGKNVMLIHRNFGNNLTSTSKLSGFIQYFFFGGHMLFVFIIKHVPCGNLRHRFIKLLSLRYDDWRYKYPELDTHQIRAKVPSQEISDMLLAGLKEMEKEERNETQKEKISMKKPYQFSVVISEN